MASQPQTELGHGAEGGGPRLSGSGEREHRQVQTVQKVRSSDHLRSPFAYAGASEGLLEDPNGVGILHSMGRDICTFRYSDILISNHASTIKEKPLEWMSYQLGRVVFSHSSSMLYLHGASLLQLFFPFVLLEASPRPIYDPRPGADGVIVARVPSALFEDISLKELFVILHEKICA